MDDCNNLLVMYFLVPNGVDFGKHFCILQGVVLILLESVIFWALCVTMGMLVIGSLIFFWGMVVIQILELVSDFRKAGEKQDSNKPQNPPF